MADTETPNFDFTLIEVNASANTWGGKTNDNWSLADTALQAVKATADGAAQKAQNLNDLSDKPVARTNLGVPTGASGAVLGFLNGNNTHSGANVFSGNNSHTGGDVWPAYIHTSTTTYVLGLADANRPVIGARLDGALAISVPNNAVAPFPVGASIPIISSPVMVSSLIIHSGGLATLYFQGEQGGVTLSPGAQCVLTKVATDTWVISGAWGVS